MPEYSSSVSLCEGRKMRLDLYLSDSLGILTRSQLKARRARFLVNGRDVKISFSVKSGDDFSVFWEDSPPQNLIAEDIELDIMYEDDRVIVVNKAQGMVVHPAAGNRSGTLLNALYGRMRNRGSLPALRPFAVHRLDKDTSGVIISAFDSESLEFLQNQFKRRTVKKTYIAFCAGAPPAERGLISGKICRDEKNRKRFKVSALRGRDSLTFYKVKRIFYMPDGSVYSLLAIRPKTGRTHQIRVHLKSAGCPVLGDAVYGIKDRNFAGETLALHALRLSITLPDGYERSVFKAPVPKRFFPILNKLRLNDVKKQT